MLLGLELAPLSRSLHGQQRRRFSYKNRLLMEKRRIINNLQLQLSLINCVRLVMAKINLTLVRLMSAIIKRASSNVARRQTSNHKSTRRFLCFFLARSFPLPRCSFTFNGKSFSLLKMRSMTHKHNNMLKHQTA